MAGAVAVSGPATDSFGARTASLRAILHAKPNNGRVTAELSTLLAEQSKATGNDALRLEAVKLARRAIEVAPQRPFGYAALSVASNVHAERIDALHRAIERSRKHVIPRTGFYVRLLIEPREEEARTVKGKLAKTSSDHPGRARLSDDEFRIYRNAKDGLQEIYSTKEALSADQRDFICRFEYRLGLFFRKLEPPLINQPRARLHFRRCISYGGKNAGVARFWLETMSKAHGSVGDDPSTLISVTKCPAEYIVGLYSTFADNFDEQLVEKLEYQTPTKLRELLDEMCVSCGVQTRFWQDALDLGCGTGLSGCAFEEVAGRMVGIDLSPEMIAKAKDRGCYDELWVGDVTDALTTSSERRYDMVFACDVFVYIGDLCAVFDGVARSLKPGGMFCFSTEYMKESVAGARPYMLHANARFAHKKSYLEGLAGEFDFTVLAIRQSPIRKNGGRPVDGMLAVFQKL